MTASAMEKVITGMMKLAVCSSSDLVLVSPGLILPEYSRVSSSSRIFDPKEPMAKMTVFCASFWYLFKMKQLSFLISIYIIPDFPEKGNRV